MSTRRVACLLVACLLASVSPGEPASPVATTGPASQPATGNLRDWVVNPIAVAPGDQPTVDRIVSTAPSATEICCALGLRDQLVARSRYCNYPPGIRQIPSIGAVDETNLEALLRLRPDLVLVSGTSRAITERLTRLRIKPLSLPDESLADVFGAIRLVGAHTGRSRTAGALCAAIDRQLGEIADAAQTAPPASVLIVLAPLREPPTPPFVAGPGSFHDDLLRRAGHRNACRTAGHAYAPLSLEAIVRLNPDVIIELDAEGGRAGNDRAARAAWARLGQLAAVADKRVHVLTGRQHFLPGPRVAQTFQALCAAIAGGEE